MIMVKRPSAFVAHYLAWRKHAWMAINELYYFHKHGR